MGRTSVEMPFFIPKYPKITQKAPKYAQMCANVYFPTHVHTYTRAIHSQHSKWANHSIKPTWGCWKHSMGSGNVWKLPRNPKQKFSKFFFHKKQAMLQVTVCTVRKRTRTVHTIVLSVHIRCVRVRCTQKCCTLWPG